jgi:protease-4
LRKAAKDGKPVVAALGSTAASGGYYVAAGCEQIVANPGTLTGSIGVIMEFINLEGTFEKLGLKSEIVKSGKYKDAGNYARSLTPEERRMLQATIDDVHGQFVAAVAEGRNLSAEQVEAVADGRVFSGQQALALGLVDKLGTFYDAVDLLKEKMGVKGKVELIFPKKKYRTDILDYFIEETSDRLRESLPRLLDREDERRLYFR